MDKFLERFLIALAFGVPLIFVLDAVLDSLK